MGVIFNMAAICRCVTCKAEGTRYFTFYALGGGAWLYEVRP
jgi:hypothetical protein